MSRVMGVGVQRFQEDVGLGSSEGALNRKPPQHELAITLTHAHAEFRF